MIDKGINTIAVHGGEAPDPETGASSPNIVMSSTYVVDQPTSFSITNMDDDTPYVYTRWANPTIRRVMVESSARGGKGFIQRLPFSGLIVPQFHP